MKLKTLEALQSFVMSVKHMTINDDNADIQKAGDELDSMLDAEIKVISKVDAVKTARTILEALNTQVHEGVPINGNGRILKAMEVLDVAFQDEFGIGR